MMIDPYRIRKDFPILKREVNGHPLVYFDNAATSQKPRQVIDAVKEFYECHNANVHRAVHSLSQEASELYECAHEEVAQFVGADGMEEIVFLRGTTEAVNLVAYSWGLRDLKEDDEIIVSLMEHHSNIVPWELISRINHVKIRYAPVDKDGALDYRRLENLMSNRTKLVCVSHVSNVTGIINDVKAVAQLAHDHGALVLVDAAQSVPHMPVDVKNLDVDFLAFSGHKMLGPTGIGALYSRREILEKIEPFHGGGEMIREVSFDSEAECCRITWNVLPWKFEAGTPNVSGAVGLLEAVRYLRRLKMDAVWEHERSLTEYALSRMKDCCEGLEVYGPHEVTSRCGIVPFNVKGLSSHDVALFLDSYGIMVRSGFHCAQPLHEALGLNSSARASFYIYNTKEEIDRFVEVLMEVKGS